MIRLSTLLRESVEFTPRGNLWIGDASAIPDDKWEKLTELWLIRDTICGAGV